MCQVFLTNEVVQSPVEEVEEEQQQDQEVQTESQIQMSIENIMKELESPNTE